MLNDSTIAAIATSAGMGAIAVIRLSGVDSIAIADTVYSSHNGKKKLVNQKPYTIHYGSIVDENRVVDEVLISIFHGPKSFTGEDVVEISCHGSVIIQQQILELLVRKGARLAQPGEFTLRAFINGKMDLSQAEGVADLIAASSEAARRVAFQQMRGGFSLKLRDLREKLVHFAAMVELELDFSEEDVEFADRTELEQLVLGISHEVRRLIDSFSFGNAIKNGIPVTIAGSPNVGKSTLLNRLLHEERAIVSAIAGTTRDSIEDTINILGVNFRFIDTAGLRNTSDEVENIGIARAKEKIEQAHIVLYVVDAQSDIDICLSSVIEFANSLTNGQTLIVILNKEDKTDHEHVSCLVDAISTSCRCDTLSISAKSGSNIEQLTNLLVGIARRKQPENEDVVVTNARHYSALLNAFDNLNLVLDGIKTGLSGDLLAIDIRQVLYHIGTITGEVTNNDILGHIFSKFCIGK